MQYATDTVRHPGRQSIVIKALHFPSQIFIVRDESSSSQQRRGTLQGDIRAMVILLFVTMAIWLSSSITLS